MSEPRPLLRLRLKFAALGIVGAAVVGLPLSQVLRFQGAELQNLLSERQALDPLTNAVAVQRNLIGHRDVAERVLRGRDQLEPERRLRQSSVDESLWALQGTLSAGQWLQALAESGAMMQDWRTLVRRIGSRQIDPGESQTQHQLLVEQAVQVMDFVSASAAPGSYAQLAGLLTKPPGAASASQGSVAPGAMAQAAEPLMAARLVALEQALSAHKAMLDERAANLRGQRTALRLAAAALVAFALGLTILAWRTGPAVAVARSDDNRRSHGRRAGDLALQVSESSRLVERLRSATGAQPVAPPKHWP